MPTTMMTDNAKRGILGDASSEQCSGSILVFGGRSLTSRRRESCCVTLLSRANSNPRRCYGSVADTHTVTDGICSINNCDFPRTSIRLTNVIRFGKKYESHVIC